MKKLKNIVVALFLAVLCVFAVACQKDVTGVYKTKTVTVGDTTVAVGETFPGASEAMVEDFFVLELKADKVAVISQVDGIGDSVSYEGTWEQKSKTIVVTFVMDGETYTINGEQEGENLKVDVFGQYTVVIGK